jgi:hypothetical protein
MEIDNDDYLRFDERTNVLSSLELLKLVLSLVRGNPLLWKWAIIGAHDALQGALVCAYQDTSRTSVTAEEAQKKVLAWHEVRGCGEYPKERLAEFGTLLDRCLSARVLEVPQEKVEDIRRLHNEFRNPLAHFLPMGWAIETAGLPRIITAAVDAVFNPDE